MKPGAYRVVRADGTPVAGASVLVFEQLNPAWDLTCSDCGSPVFSCAGPASVVRVIQGLRDGSLRRGPPRFTTTSAADGTFNLPLGGEVVVRTPEGFAFPDDSEPSTYELEPSAAPRVRVVDEHEAPFPDAEVWVFNPLDDQVRSVRSGPDGQLTLEPADAEAWLGVDRAGFVPMGGFTTDLEELVLTPAASLVIKTQALAVPIDAEVEVVEPRHTVARRTKNAEARIDLLPRGSEVSVRAFAGERNADKVDVLLDREVNEVVLELAPSALVVLTVSCDGRHFIEAELTAGDDVHLSETAWGPKVTLLLGPVAPGPATLDVNSRDLPLTTLDLNLHLGRNDVQVHLEPGVEVRGVVLDPEGKPVEGAEVGRCTQKTSYSLWAASRTKADGAFALQLPSAGPVCLRASDRRWGQAELLVTAPASDVRLAFDSSVVELVIDAADPPPKGDALISSADAGVFKHVSFDGQPQATEVLPPGPYVLETWFDGFPKQRRAFELGPRERKRLTLDLRAGARIAGRVVDSHQTPLSGVSLSVMCEELFVDATSDENGHFSATGLVPGSHCYVDVTGNEETTRVEVPQEDLVLTIEGGMVRGRAIDESGRPLTSVEVDDRSYETQDGHFAAFSKEETVTISAPLHEPAVFPRKDLGTFVLHQLRACSGVVVDHQGRRVPRAELRNHRLLTREPLRADADGSFQLKSFDSEPFLVTAKVGARTGTAQCQAGATVRIELTDPVALHGLVLDEGGRPSAEVVELASDYTDERRLVTPDPTGQFVAEVARGPWTFTQPQRFVSRTFSVTGPQSTVVLGPTPGSCAVRVSSEAWLFPKGTESALGGLFAEAFRLTPGAVHLFPAPGTTALASGLPCGDYRVRLDFEWHPVQLTPPVTDIQPE